MKELERELREYGDINKIDCDEEKIAVTLIKSKKVFYESMYEKKSTYIEFLRQQAKFIKKRWWVYQACVLLIAWWGMSMTNSVFLTKRCMGVLAPIFVILIIPELWKNRSFQSMEIEGAAFHFLSKVYAARMILFAMVDIFLLDIFLIMVSYSLKIEMREIIIQFFIPMLVTCCICFRMLCGRQENSEYMAVFISALWMGIWIFIVLKESVYQMISIPIWMGISCCLIAYLIYIIRKVLVECNSYWEEKMLWS